MAKSRAGRGRTSGRYRLPAMPRFWIWTQVLICLFVLIGIVIAITKLA
jgi:hypothetical protein